MSLDCEAAFSSEMQELKKLNQNLEALVKIMAGENGVLYQLALNAKINEAILNLLGGRRA